MLLGIKLVVFISFSIADSSVGTVESPQGTWMGHNDNERPLW